MTVLQALFLGILQGLTEFLPVSSSGHLVLAQRLMNVNLGGADMLFDLTLHLGTLLAVCFVFRKKIFELFRRPFKTLLYLFAASLPAAAVGLFLGDIIDSVFFGGTYLAFGFALSAALLTGAQIRAKKAKNTLPLNFGRTMCMGAAQALAVLPGISRSGATVAAGIIAGGNGEEVADFSFLLSIPVILGGFAVTLFKGVSGGELHAAFAAAGDNFGLCVAVSVAASAIAGLFAIKIMLRCISSAKYTPFIIYLCLLAAACGALRIGGIL